MKLSFLFVMWRITIFHCRIEGKNIMVPFNKKKAIMRYLSEANDDARTSQRERDKWEELDVTRDVWTTMSEAAKATLAQQRWVSLWQGKHEQQLGWGQHNHSANSNYKPNMNNNNEQLLIWSPWKAQMGEEEKKNAKKWQSLRRLGLSCFVLGNFSFRRIPIPSE